MGVSRFLNCTNGTKSRNARHLRPLQTSTMELFFKNSVFSRFKLNDDHVYKIGPKSATENLTVA